MNNGKNSVSIKVYDKKRNSLVNRQIDELIPELVAAQINIDFQLEAIKCQTIIVRTALIRKARAFGGKGCSKHKEADFCLEGHCGKWISKEELKKKWEKDFDRNWEKLLKAEEETKYLVMTFNNKVIDPRFHSTCGGATDNSENVDDYNTAYLRKVLCNYCIDSPCWKNIKELNTDEIEEKFNVRFKKLSSLNGANIEGMIEEIERDEEGRVKKIKVGDKILKGTDFCECLGLDSTRFGWEPVVLRFETRGKGHGLGLCQYGANSIAEQGGKAQEILKYYYTGIDIKKYEMPDRNRPINNKVIVIDPGHGGEENVGVIGQHKLMEKDISLSIALDLKRELEDLGAKVILTREDDVYIPLSSRARTANKIRPNFFISIHMNSFTNPNISGTEIYHYRGDKEGEVMANFIIKNMEKELRIVNKGVKIADFYLLKTVTTSALHIEVEYLTNPEEERKFLNNDYTKRIARSIANGITEYYKYQI
ncbi:stage II sporulation protein D [Paramaledivibacter caminithermalis]|uniref:Stage II sporulation protein D n=1 Tax=Paramaledivibacter caminithermalis (strain DSM 15212 / CIP 107654 / DViRD3) TaxID=1121301 RepID=A0A1M6KHJ1_PARC5|nr:stage II sporulation protein D [Paramaledivibacter caminithermalis]SHJ58387.1 stage II sporulation protein D [Paramaledivibacter caminithermalis DSM 15212]